MPKVLSEPRSGRLTARIDEQVAELAQASNSLQSAATERMQLEQALQQLRHRVPRPHPEIRHNRLRLLDLGH